MEATSTNRPTAITIICIIGFVGVIFSVLAFFSPIMSQLGELYPWYPPYLGVSIVIGLICMVGLWMMKNGR